MLVWATNCGDSARPHASRMQRACGGRVAMLAKALGSFCRDPALPDDRRRPFIGVIVRAIGAHSSRRKKKAPVVDWDVAGSLDRYHDLVAVCAGRRGACKAYQLKSSAARNESRDSVTSTRLSRRPSIRNLLGGCKGRGSVGSDDLSTARGRAGGVTPERYSAAPRCRASNANGDNLQHVQRGLKPFPAGMRPAHLT
jgi:hypothetical protein